MLVAMLDVAAVTVRRVRQDPRLRVVRRLVVEQRRAAHRLDAEVLRRIGRSPVIPRRGVRAVTVRREAEATIKPRRNTMSFADCVVTVVTVTCVFGEGRRRDACARARADS